MLEIRSEIQPTWFGNPNVFIIYMKRNGIEYYCGMEEGSWMNDGDKVKTCISALIHELIGKCYPELYDPLYRLEQTLKQLDEERQTVINSIEIIKQNRKE